MLRIYPEVFEGLIKRTKDLSKQLVCNKYNGTGESISDHSTQPPRTAHSKKLKFIFLSPRSKKLIATNLIAIRSTTSLMRAMAPTGPVFFLQIASNGASYDTKIGCIQFLLAVAKNFTFYFCYAQALFKVKYQI